MRSISRCCRPGRPRRIWPAPQLCRHASGTATSGSAGREIWGSTDRPETGAATIVSRFVRPVPLVQPGAEAHSMYLRLQVSGRTLHSPSMDKRVAGRRYTSVYMSLQMVAWSHCGVVVGATGRTSGKHPQPCPSCTWLPVESSRARHDSFRGSADGQSDPSVPV